VAAPTKSAGSGVGGAIGGAVARRLLGALAGLIVLAVIVVGVIVYMKVANPDHLGQVVFTTSDMSSSTDCTVSNQVSSVKAGTPVYATYFWQHQLTATQQVVEEDFKDGTSLGTYNVPTDSSSDADCLTVQDDLNATFTDPGTYEIKLTVGNEVVADGKLTITP
jgi:hypothetical protein